MKNRQIYNDLNIKRTFYSIFMKRFLDMFLSFIAIVCLSPFLLIFAILTLIFNGYPILYKQARPGKNHKLFYIYKFRSMNNKKDELGNYLPDEQRITKWGRFIRKTSIDELPQLFNILKGDMSFVGPRPRLVKDIMFYNEDVFKYYFVRPGLTGATQTTGRNLNTWEQVFKKDIAYINKITFWGDLKIFVKTFISVFTSKGESHTNLEEDKKYEKEQEYYYADYILRIGKIKEEQYRYGIALSKKIIQNKEDLIFHPEILNYELFEIMNEYRNKEKEKSAKEFEKQQKLEEKLQNTERKE